jgi:hypothetical protein
MANSFFKILKNPFVGFASPFFLSPGGENSPKTNPDRDIHKVMKRQHQYPEFGHT